MTSRPRIRALLWSAFMGAAGSLSLVVAYLALAGPAYYFSHRVATKHPAFLQAVRAGCEPAEVIAVSAPFYGKFLCWCADSGHDAWRDGASG